MTLTYIYKTHPEGGEPPYETAHLVTMDDPAYYPSEGDTPYIDGEWYRVYRVIHRVEPDAVEALVETRAEFEERVRSRSRRARRGTLNR